VLWMLCDAVLRVLSLNHKFLLQYGTDDTIAHRKCLARLGRGTNDSENDNGGILWDELFR